MPEAMTAETASEAWFTLSKMARRVTVASGRWRRRTQTFVTMPSVPSEPTTTPARS